MADIVRSVFRLLCLIRRVIRDGGNVVIWLGNIAVAIVEITILVYLVVHGSQPPFPLS